MSDQNGHQPQDDEAKSDESFEDMLGALEAVVGELEEGNLSLSATLETFEQGMNLARRCQVLLAQAELRITQIETESDAASEPRQPTDLFNVPF